MKKLFYLAAAAIAAVAISCGKTNSEGPGGNNQKDDGIVGTWLMRLDEYHYFNVTFKEDGSYEWLWQGAGGNRLDKGTYKLENNVITTTAKEVFEADYETGEMQKSDLENWGWAGVRTITVVKQDGPVAWWSWKDDYLMQDSGFFGEDSVIIFKKGADFGIKASDLLGTWEVAADGGVDRVVFESGTVTWYTTWKTEEAEGGISATKNTGNWSLEGNVLTINYKMAYSSSESLGWNPETQQNEYIYYKVDPVTLECENWQPYNQEFTETHYIYLKGNELFMRMATYTKK